MVLKNELKNYDATLFNEIIKDGRLLEQKILIKIFEKKEDCSHVSRKKIVKMWLLYRVTQESRTN